MLKSTLQIDLHPQSIFVPSSQYSSAASLPMPQRLNNYFSIPRGEFGIMVDYKSMDSKSLIAAALKPGAEEPARLPKAFTPYVPPPADAKGKEAPTARKKRGRPRKHHNPDTDPESSGDGVEGPRCKKSRWADKVVGEGIAIGGDDDGNGEIADDNEPKPKEKPRRGRKSSKFTTTAGTMDKAPERKKKNYPIPLTLASAHPADKKILEMKDAGKPWREIKPIWEEMTGQTVGDSTLSVRYSQIKRNLEKGGSKEVSFSCHLFPACFGLLYLTNSLPLSGPFLCLCSPAFRPKSLWRP